MTTQHALMHSNCQECEQVASRVQKLAKERDVFRQMALEMGDELNRLRHFKNATLRLARDMPERSGLALEPMTHDTWHQPEKKLKSKAPFTFGSGK